MQIRATWEWQSTTIKEPEPLTPAQGNATAGAQTATIEKQTSNLVQATIILCLFHNSQTYFLLAQEVL